MLDQGYTAQGIGHEIRNTIHALHGGFHSERRAGYMIRNLGYAAYGIGFVVYSLNYAAYSGNCGNKKTGQEVYPARFPFCRYILCLSGLHLLLYGLFYRLSIRSPGRFGSERSHDLAKLLR